jgi:hypothetical protein
MLPPIFPLLSSDSSVTGLVGAPPNCRIYQFGMAPDEGTPRYAEPYVTWFLVAGVPYNSMSDRPNGDAYRVQVDVWAKTASEGLAVARAIRDALEVHAHMLMSSTDRDQETRLYRYSLDFQFIEHR